MEEIKARDLIEHVEYSQLIEKSEINFFRENGRFNHKKRVIEKLRRVFKHVETYGRSNKLTFQLNKKIEDAIIDKRSIATTNQVILKLAQNANMIISKNDIGKMLTSREWLRKIGFNLFFNKFELINLLKKLTKDIDSDVTYHKIFVDLDDYVQPSILDVLADSVAIDFLIESFNRFYGYIFQSVISHSNLKFKRRYAGINDENEIIVLDKIEQASLESFENLKMADNKNRKALIRSKEYQEFINSKFGLNQVWREFELTECKNNTEKEITNQSEIFDGCVKMFTDSLTKREINIKKIPYEFEKKAILKNAEIQDLIELGLAVDVENEKTTDNIEFRLIKDRLLVKSVAKIIELMNPDYHVDLTIYHQYEKDWLEHFREQLIH